MSRVVTLSLAKAVQVVYVGKFEKDIEGKVCNLTEIRCRYLGMGKKCQ